MLKDRPSIIQSICKDLVKNLKDFSPHQENKAKNDDWKRNARVNYKIQYIGKKKKKKGFITSAKILSTSNVKTILREHVNK